MAFGLGHWLFCGVRMGSSITLVGLWRAMLRMGGNRELCVNKLTAPPCLGKLGGLFFF